MMVLLFVSLLSLSGAVCSGIFGGHEAKPHSRPYMASLQVRGHHVCGGVLIREDYVLTAAHCYNRSDPLDKIVMGAHNISKKEKSQQSITISKFIPHPKYPQKELRRDDPRTQKHDIMLLKLKSNATVGQFVKVMLLPRTYRNMRAGEQCEVAGWGKRVLGRAAESALYEATVKLDKTENCKRIWQQHYNPDQMTCSVSNGREGFCQGDSGGPLFCSLKGEGKILYAVIAYTGDPCDDIRFPEVYTRVAFFLPWIKEVLGGNDAL